MAQASDAVWLPVLPSMKGFGPALVKGAGAEADTAGKSVGQRFGKAMVVGTAAVVGGAAAAGTALYNLGAVFDDVTDTIRTGTGATGKDLDGLVSVAKRVGSTVPAEFSAVGTTVADVNTRMGLTGQTLQTVASQYLEAGRVLGEEVDIAKTSAAFNAFQIKGEDVSGALDHLFQVSQATGLGMNEIASSVSRNAPALQTLGFGFEEAAAMVGSFDKAGLNTNQVMASMSKGLVTLAQDGEQPAEAFKRVQGEIAGFIKSGDDAAALNLASEVFGTRGAVQFIGAVKSGSLSLDDMTKAAGQTGDTILGVGEDTADFAEQWQLFKNKVLVWLEPMGARVFGALGTLMGEVTGGVEAFGAAWAANDGDITSSGIPGMLERFGFWARTAFDYVQGTALPALRDFGGFLGDTFGPSLDRVGGFLTGSVVPALRDFGGFILAEILPAVVSLAGWIGSDVIPALGAFSSFLLDNSRTIGIVAGVIAALLIPALVRKGVVALASAWKSVTAWTMEKVEAIRTAGVYLVQSYRIIGTWVAMGIAALRSGAQTVAIWALYKVEAIKAAGVYVAQQARIVGAWVAMGVAAAASGARTAAVWVGTMVASAVTGAASFVVQAARVVGGWALMGVQALLHAARMAAAWVIAMGPIGWIIAGVVGLVTLIVLNWEKVKAVTLAVFGAVAGFVSRVWRNIVAGVKAAVVFVWGLIKAYFTFYYTIIRTVFTAVWGFLKGVWGGIKTTVGDAIDWVRTKIDNVVRGIRILWRTGWDLIKKTASDVWNGIKDTIRNVWTNYIRPVFDAFGNFIEKHVKPAFRRGVDGIKQIWESIKSVAKKPISFIVNTVLNKGLIPAVNTVRGWFNMGPLEPIDIPGFARGGWTGPGGKYDPAGIVHADEFVIRKESQRRLARERPGLLDHLNREGTVEGYRGYANGGLVRPVAGGTVTSGFGAPRGAYPHQGIDFAVPIGTAVRAALDGVVLNAGWNAIGGRTGIGGFLGHEGGRNTYYGHLSKLLVQVGDLVKAGQVIGLSGNTGRSTGPHLHFETWTGGRPVDPAPYVAGGALPGGGGGFMDFLGPLAALAGGVVDRFKEEFPLGGAFIDMVAGAGKHLLDAGMEWVRGKVADIGDFLTGGLFSGGSGAVKDAVRGVATGYGWGAGPQWNALSEIIQRESSWNPDAANPSSSARGLFQKMTSLHGPVEGTPEGQARWGLHYIASRYGDPLRALDFHNRNGHYADGGLVDPMRFLLRDNGGELPEGLSLVLNNTGAKEWVFNRPQLDRLNQAVLAGDRGGPTVEMTVIGEDPFAAAHMARSKIAFELEKEGWG